MAEKKFVDGMFVSRRENAPEFVIAQLSFNTEKMIDWLKQNTNAKGFCNVDIQRSATGSLYASLNEWQPSNQGQTNSQESQQEEEIEVGSVPF